jgi:GNAT superfamily N-acetyltransferase
MPNASDRESDRIGFEPDANTVAAMRPRSDGAAMLRRTLMERVQGPLAGSIGLRPAIAADESFLYRVYASTREDELQLVDWNDAQKTALLTMQFNAQRSSYRQGFPGSGYDVISLGEQPVGRLFVLRGTAAIRVVDLGLLPEFRNRGIGGAFLNAVLNEAAEAGKPIRLHVESFNRAMKLYERLGFSAVGINGIHVEMEWAPRIPFE